MKSMIISFPAVSEQKRIVAKVDELMALCDRIKECITDAGALQRNLADSMVAQAVA
jgi:type I restriction enzyme S subunit